MADFMGNAKSLSPAARPCVYSYDDLLSVTESKTRFRTSEMISYDYCTLVCGDDIDRYRWFSDPVLLEQRNGKILFLTHISPLLDAGQALPERSHHAQNPGWFPTCQPDVHLGS